MVTIVPTGTEIKQLAYILVGHDYTVAGGDDINKFRCVCAMNSKTCFRKSNPSCSHLNTGINLFVKTVNVPLGMGDAGFSKAILYVL